MIRNLLFIAALCPMLVMAAAQPFVGVLLWSWISFMNPHREMWGAAANLPWALMVLCATLVGCIIAREPRRLPLNAVTILLLVLLVIFTITTLTGLGVPADAWAKWDRTVKVIIVLLLTASLLTDRHRVDSLIWLMVIAIGYYGVRGGAFTILTGGSFRVLGPEATIIADNNHIGAAMLVSLPLMNYLRLNARHRIVRLGLAAAMGFTLFGIVGTYSRGALLGLGAVVVVMWLRSRRKLIGGGIMALSVAAAITFMPPQWITRMNTINTYGEDASATTRLKLWEVSFLLAVDRPLVGSGFRGPYTRDAVDSVMPGGPARAVHSIWFEVLGEHGFPGFLAWLGMTIAGLWYSWKLLRLSRGHPQLAWAGHLARMLQVSMVAYCVSGTFLSLGYWDYFWTILVIIPAALSIVRHSLEAEAMTGDSTVPAQAVGAWVRQGQVRT